MTKLPGPPSKATSMRLDEQHLHAGLRLGIAVSGGADSVALLRAVLARRQELGLVLSVVHVHHGLRGAEADRDQVFVENLAKEHGLPLYVDRVDTAERAAQYKETTEEAARHLRYAFFGELLKANTLDAVATAHTLDDQAETVLLKLLRGAWTEGLGGISPMVSASDAPGATAKPAAGPVTGKILRPMLETTREEVERYLGFLGQAWREDATNQDSAFTRNRVRHHLLPILHTYNPQIATQLSRLSTIARDEELYWQREVARVGSGMVLPGKPVRGGGRSSSTHPEEAFIALEIERLRTLSPALQRRVLRWFAEKIGCTLAFDQTERLMQLAVPASPDGSSSRRVDLHAEVSVQRTARELQFIRRQQRLAAPATLDIPLPIPGEVDVVELQLRFIATLSPEKPAGSEENYPSALIRYARPGDKATQRFSRGPKRLKEILERLHQSAEERANCPVVVWPSADRDAPIVWMAGVALDPASLPDLPFVLEVTHLGLRTGSDA